MTQQDSTGARSAAPANTRAAAHTGTPAAASGAAATGTSVGAAADARAVRIAILGAEGRMGRALAEAAPSFAALEWTRAYTLPNSPQLGADAGVAAGGAESGVRLESSDAIAGGGFDVLIDFSVPQATLRALQACVSMKRAMVIGTTGFSAAGTRELETAAKTIPLVVAPNMSIGVNLCLKLLRDAAAVFGEDADIEIVEAHHRHKVDAPSGTALKMGEVVAEALGRNLEDCAVYQRHGQTGARPAGAIGFQSIRAGDIVGEHKVLFALDGERIEISHKAASRLGFVRGALHAAAWVAGRTPGLYDMRAVLGL